MSDVTINDDFGRLLFATRHIKELQQQNLELFEDNETLVEENSRLTEQLRQLRSFSKIELAEVRQEELIKSLRGEIRELQKSLSETRKTRDVFMGRYNQLIMK
jgi:predicted RNase H-like nuclease (RuvC/YqgF family)